MKYLTRANRGTYGYIRKQTIFEIIKTIVLFAMALGLFLIGYLTLGTKKSLWSVFAILGMLPACKSLVGVIMLLRFRSVSADSYAKITNIIENLPVLFENILTTSETSFYIPYIIYSSSTLCIFCNDNKDRIKKLSSHFDTVLSKGGHKDITFKIYTDEDDFLKRCEQLRAIMKDDDAARSRSVFATIKAVSL